MGYVLKYPKHWLRKLLGYDLLINQAAHQFRNKISLLFFHPTPICFNRKERHKKAFVTEISDYLFFFFCNNYNSNRLKFVHYFLIHIAH